MELDLFAVRTKEENELTSRLIGCSSCRWKDSLVVTGGVSNGGGNGAAFALQFLHLSTIQWKLQALPAFPNRYYHASVPFQDQIYLFGGFHTIAEGDSPHPVLSISLSRFGYKLTKVDVTPIETEGNVFNQQLLALGGHSAHVMGKEQDKIVLFGGFSHNNQLYSNEIILFTPSAKSKSPTSTGEVKIIPIEGIKPDPRAFHTAVVLGGENQHLLLVHGGKTAANEILNDIWILDLNEIVNSNPNQPPVEAVVDKNAKGAAKGKGKEPVQKGPSGYWYKVNIDSFSSTILPRCQHSLVSVQGEQSGVVYSLYVVGGISNQQCHSLASIHRIDLAEDSSTKYAIRAVEEITVPTVSNPINQRLLSKETIYGANVTLLTINDAFPDKSNSDEGENGNLGFLVYGGVRLSQNEEKTSWSEKYNITYFLTLNKDRYVNEFKQLNAKIKAANQHIPELYASDEEFFAQQQLLTRIQYGNGDVYIGEVISTSDDSSAEQKKDSNEEGIRIGSEDSDIPHGQGTMQYSTGEVYEGSWGMGKRAGKGKLTYYDPALRINGQAISSLLTYEGSFFDDSKHGEGVLTDEDNTFRYTGTFIFDLFAQDGELITFTNGDRYIGSFNNGLKNGRGELRNTSLNYRYIGNWKDDQYQEGEVEQFGIVSYNPLTRFSLKGSYTGTVQNGLPSGLQGTCIYEDGSKYVGSWKSGKKNGYGEYFFVNGDRYDGKWVGDKRCGYGKFFSKINSEYEGQWENDFPHGHGVMFYHNHTYFIGDFVKGLREGVGQLFQYTATKEGIDTTGEGRWSSTLHPGTTGSLEEAKDTIIQQGLWLNDNFVR